ncbi:MAG: hypothetical protein K2I81_03150 [Alphaproteobacteria bacterium]|nr:hypothetical protein [Alphaproteobacteria bacterium]
MNADLQNNMAILMGETGRQNSPQLSAETKQKLSNAYFDLFFGLAGANWGRADKTLGAAWYEALSQIKAMIAAKDKSNPAAMYLNQIFAAHNAKWSQIIMTNPNSDKKLEIDSQDRKKWSADCAKKIGDAMGAINSTVAQYKQKDMPRQATNPLSQQQIQKKILMFMAAQKNIKSA